MSGRTPGLGPVLLTVLLDLVGFGLVIPLLPFYAESYGATEQQAILLMGTYSLAQLFFAPLWGQLSDRVGRRPVMLFSIAGTALFLFAFALAPSLGWLYVTRFLHGACAANISTAQAYVADVTTPADRARGMGLIGASFGLGFTIGPFLGGELARFGLAAPILLAAGLSALNLVWAALRLPESRTPGAAPSARRSLDPTVLARALQHPTLGALLGLMFAGTLAFATMEFSFGLVAEHVWFPGSEHREVAMRVGRMFGSIGVIGILIQGGLIGRLVKRFGEPRLIATGYAITGAGLLAMAGARGGWESWLVCALLAVGTSLSNPSVQALISRTASADEQGAVLGVNQSLGALARAGAPWLAAALYADPIGLAALSGSLGLPAEADGAFRGLAFLVAGLGTWLALAASLAGVRRAANQAASSA